MKILNGIKIFLSILLSIIAFFFIGGIIAKYAGVAKGQGLAGGPIIIFYGLTSIVIGLIATLIVYKFYPDKILLFNSLLIIVLLVIGFVLFNC